ncbi:MAG: GH3 auxin-responsive promoter family protein [Oscillospiraceae bacterium]|nr:GH3 auxin-responsive promoter family protein [Oscillospiraceae bacterium]
MSLYGTMMKAMCLVGKSAVRSLEEMTKKPEETQEALLLSVLGENQDTEYGRKYGFSQIRSVRDYQERVPVREYDDFAPYIERMVKGEDGVLTNEHIEHYNKTSGTLGCAKYIPLSKKQLSVTGKYHALHTNSVIASQLGYGWNNGKGVNLMEGTAVVLESGATYGSASSVAVKSGPFKNMSSGIYTSPVEARRPAKGVITRYIHARFALQERNVTYVEATFSSIILEMFRYIEDHCEMLLRDIETGTIDGSVELPEDVRASLLAKLKPDPRRAEELRAAFAEGFGKPWAKRIWPGLQFIFSAGGANFSPYTEKLKKNILGDDVRIFYQGVSASEGMFSAVYRMDCVDSVLTPDGCFMEFRDAEDENAPCLTMDKLEKDKCYELIITNYSGLYRYRMHDVLRVTGFHNRTPLVQFEMRAGYAANIRGEKTSEAAVRNMVEETEKTLGIEVTDYSIYADTDAVPPAYVILMELRSRPEGVDNEAIRKCLKEKLIQANKNIAHHFEEGYLGDLQLALVQPETYLLYRDVMIMRGTSASQLKPVNVIRNEFQRKFFFGLRE